LFHVVARSVSCGRTRVIPGAAGAAMMGQWNLPVQSVEPPEFAVETVLAEYNGPQIVTVRGSEGLYLGVATDEEEGGASRWIYASITSTELSALFAGLVAVRDVLQKPTVWVIDINAEGKNTQAWLCDFSQIDEGNLPETGALLPEETRGAFGIAPPSEPELRLDQSGLNGQGVPFRHLAEFLGVFQRFWNAIAQARSEEGPKDRGRLTADLSERASLSLTSAGAGSLILHLKPSDSTIFDDVSAWFEALAAARDEPAKLASLLARLGPRVQARYSELLTNLEKHGFQVLTRRPTGGAFLSSSSAPRILAALPRAELREAKTVTATGYFVAFDTGRGAFEFYDDSAGEAYGGHVFPDVLAQNTAVMVGIGVKYTVAIEVTTWVSASGQVIQSSALRGFYPPSTPSRSGFVAR
jgi:hypothetical protein